MGLIHDKIAMGVVLLVVTLASGFYPFYKHYQTKLTRDFPLAEAFSGGIFLSVGFLHLLKESILGFSASGGHWFYAVLIALVTMLAMFCLDALMHRAKLKKQAMPLLVVLMLCVHGFFEGAALGLSEHIAVVYLVFFAIIIHKWAESFALSIVLTGKNQMSFKLGLFCFLIFAMMTPLGVALGTYVIDANLQYEWLKPMCDAIAAGTFIYFGAGHTFFHLEHGLRKKTFLRQAAFWSLGVAIMGIASLWI